MLRHFFFFFFLMFYFSSSFIYPSLRWPGAQAKTADVTSEVALWLGGETRAHLVLCHVPGRPLKFYSESFITKVVLFPSLSSLWLMSYCLSLLSIWSLSVWWSRSICRVQISFFFWQMKNDNEEVTVETAKTQWRIYPNIKPCVNKGNYPSVNTGSHTFSSSQTVKAF